MKQRSDTDGPRKERNGSRRVGPSPGQKASFAGYVNYQPTPEQKATFALWCAESDLVDEAFTRLVGDGWRFTVSYDGATASYVGAVSRLDAGHPDASIVLNVRSGSPLDILEKVCYALDVVYDCQLVDSVVVPLAGRLFD